MDNKSHWYDGWFYDKFIAPNQDKMFGEIKKLIESNTSVVDVGCGTGRFSFFVSDKVKNIVAIDLSKKNIDTANKTLQKNPNSKISFHNINLKNLIAQNYHFDFAVMTYVIHEVNPGQRIKLLNEMAQVADKIIIGDYRVPVNKGFWSVLNEAVEYFAGKNHYTNYKHFKANDGLYGLAKKAELKVINEINNTPSTSQVLMLTK